ncbi:tetratricopeptide repeat protein [Erythrobacter oryzae]|uniref:tetratricopeptide repeat protein n=1 Tax=Erythrobacter oryzae TaxID=3019556 RepID=UPI0025545A4B|nr:tetratricopeptide repeat protein [Erythrobacter sp. COR-2]
MTQPLRAALALAAAVLAAPLAAKDAKPEPLPDLAAMTIPELQALFRKDSDRWSDEPCTFGVPVLAQLESRTKQPPVPLRRLRLVAEALCADNEKRYEDGLKLSADIAALTPDDPATGLSLYFAGRLKSVDAMLVVLRGLNDTGLGELGPDSYWSVFRTARDQGRLDELDALALEWASTGKFAFLDTKLHEGIAMAALRAAAKTGRADVVDGLLVSITGPASYIDLLTFRTYEPFWPQIEARAGKNLAAVGEENVRVARAQLTNAPEDRDRFSAAATALHYNGQFEEAIALAQRWRERKAKGVAIEEGDAWALNIEAYAYDSLGQFKKADAVFDELAKYEAKEHPWVVNFVINRASRLTGQGRWREGLKATELARRVAEDYGSTYAKLIIASNRACAFERLGRARDAAPELAFLRANWKDGIGLTVQGLMCHGLGDEAAALLLGALRDEDERDEALGAFQTDELDLFYTATTLPEAPDLLESHPELGVELAKHVRAMPEEFIPQAALRRVARKEGAVR